MRPQIPDGLARIAECDEPAIAYERFFDWIRPGGTVAFMGHRNVSFDTRPNWLTLHEVTVMGPPMYRRDEHDRVQDLLAACPQASQMLTHVVGIDRAKPALDAHVAGEAGKVVLKLSAD